MAIKARATGSVPAIVRSGLMVVAYHPRQSYEKAKAMLMRP